jgi:hypothetical protein
MEMLCDDYEVRIECLYIIWIELILYWVERIMC